MYTYNQLIAKFKAFFEAHYFVNRVTSGDYETSQVAKDMVYPHVHIQPASASVGNMVGFTFDLIISDLPRVEDGKVLPTQEIHSDLAQVVFDFIAVAQNNKTYWESDQAELVVNSMDAFWDSQTQTVAGWNVSFTITQQNGFAWCNLPADSVTPPPASDCQPATLVDVDGNTLREIGSGVSFTLRNYSIQNSGGATATAPITSVAAVGRVSGETLQDLITSFNSLSNLDATASDIYTAASTDLRNELSALLCGTTSIIPCFIRPTIPTASYATGDLGDQYDSGVYDRLNGDLTGRVRVLGADSYTLDADTLNKYGTTARFTFDNGDNAWDGSSFITTYPGDATDYVIECHLTGLRLYVANLGNVNWADAITACSSLAAGGYAWRIPSNNEIENFLLDRDNLYYQGGNPFRRGVVSGYSDFYTWSSRTGETSTSNAFRVSVSQDTSLYGKTNTALMSVYAVSDFDATYTP
jgi:hypothetical protein